jgi:hypothetical protein
MNMNKNAPENINIFPIVVCSHRISHCEIPRSTTHTSVCELMLTVTPLTVSAFTQWRCVVFWTWVMCRNRPSSSRRTAVYLEFLKCFSTHCSYTVETFRQSFRNYRNNPTEGGVVSLFISVASVDQPCDTWHPSCKWARLVGPAWGGVEVTEVSFYPCRRTVCCVVDVSRAPMWAPGGAWLPRLM